MFRTKTLESQTLKIGLIAFWALFWFFNVVDKFISDPTFLWKGKDRLTQFTSYFQSIGVDNPDVALWFFIGVTIAEALAFIFLFLAFVRFIRKDKGEAKNLFVIGSLIGLFIFSFFTVGDQIFGDRVELLEHTTYWIALIVSLIAYSFFEE